MHAGPGPLHERSESPHRFVRGSRRGHDARGLNGTYPSSINVWGAITGSYQDANIVFHGFLRSPEGRFTTFEAPGADTTAGSFNGTSPNSINDLGVITGYYTDANGFSHGFLRSPDGKFTTFDVTGAGGFGSFPIAINLEGAIVGYYTDANHVPRFPTESRRQVYDVDWSGSV